MLVAATVDAVRKQAMRRGDEVQTVPVRPCNDAFSAITTPRPLLLLLFFRHHLLLLLVGLVPPLEPPGFGEGRTRRRRRQAPFCLVGEMRATATHKLRFFRTKGRLLACFEPPAVADDDAAVGEDKRTSAAALRGSQPASSPGLTPSSSSGSSLTDGEGKPRLGEGGGGKGRRFSQRRLLAKIIRSSAFVQSLNVHKGEWLYYKKQAPPPPEAAAGERAWGEDVPSSGTGFSSSSSSSSSTASSGLLGMTSPPTLAQTGKPPERKTAPTRRDREEIGGDTGGGSDSCLGFCLVLLLVLFVLVFSGRLCAIVWTCACLCLAPGGDQSDGTARRAPPRVQAAEGAGMRRGPAEEREKRRVVLEGLLDRRRRP